MPGDDDIDRVDEPDVEIGAAARAKRLRLGRKPRTQVEFHGDSPRDEVSGAERENLPEEVEPGVTYRDVRVRWRAAARIKPRDR